MKLITLIVLFLPLASIGQSMIGDVKYSIMDPTQFEDQHGPDWVLMMGQDISGSDLSIATGINTLPDARGVFIRSMNLGRAEGGDPDGNRRVGSSQSDELRSHQHKISDYKIITVQGRLIGDYDGSSAGEYEEKTTRVGGPETRPKNIVLYTYIKINNP